MRPSYLARRDGRYLLQMRVGKRAVPILGLRVLRVSLATGDSRTARRRLAMATGWATEVVHAPDLHETGRVVLGQLRTYLAAPLPDSDTLAVRLIFEDIARRLMRALCERGVSPVAIDPELPILWDRFVAQNIEIEAHGQTQIERRGYERGRADALAAVADGLIRPTREPIVVNTPRRAARAPARPEVQEDARAAIRRFEAASATGDLATSRRPRDIGGYVEGCAISAGTPVGDEIVAPTAPARSNPGARGGYREERDLGSLERVSATLPTQPALLDDATTAHAGASAGESPRLPSGPEVVTAAPTKLDILLAEHGIDSERIVPKSKPITLSEGLDAFLEAMRAKYNDGRANADTEPVCRFMISLIGDVRLNELTAGQRRRVDEALVDIPYPSGFPRCRQMSLFERYNYAKEHGWSKLRRATENTVLHRYHSGLHKYFGWLKEKQLLVGDRPTFSFISPELMSELPRDAFSDDELIRLVSLPLFTGSHSRARIWSPGTLLLQGKLYWGYLMLILTGMRPGEIGQISLDQIRTDGEFWYIDLRPFDPAEGRVPIGEHLRLKTRQSARIVPIHPLLVDLGLIERADALRKRGETKLFPDWAPYTKRTDEERWAYPITKSWQYIRAKKLRVRRADLALYGTRHLMAAWLDESGIAERSRDRILGHALSEPKKRYGRKGALAPAEARIIAAIEPPVVGRMREILMGALQKAEAGELRLITVDSSNVRRRKASA
ncbi:hypothetical protein ACTZWW_05045 [Salinarimonas sp. NSM]|uniref:hypothetical protein n=1 Tax=Salinarimonas sp. NSM TaxID=3458003 RepID=UPI0040372317